MVVVTMKSLSEERLAGFRSLGLLCFCFSVFVSWGSLCFVGGFFFLKKKITGIVDLVML